MLSSRVWSLVILALHGLEQVGSAQDPNLFGPWALDWRSIRSNRHSAPASATIVRTTLRVPAAQASLAHQTLDRARTTPVPYTAVGATLVDPVDLQVHLPDPYDLDTQQIVTLDTGTGQCRVVLLRHVSPVARRRNLHRLPDWLNAAGIAVLVDKCLHDVKRRSSSPKRKHTRLAQDLVCLA